MIHLYLGLRDRLAPGQIFFDEQIRGGSVWPEALANNLAKATVVYALIGRSWLKIQDDDTGQRLLDKPNDWVRQELENVPEATTVVPILVDGATPLPAGSLLGLPKLTYLEKLQAKTLRNDAASDWERGLDELAQSLFDLDFQRQRFTATTNSKENFAGVLATLRIVRDQLIKTGEPTVHLDSCVATIKGDSRADRIYQKGDMVANRWELLEKLGIGGFGTVWKARHDPGKDLVAVKLLHSQWRDTKQEQMFELGARRMDQIRHPRVVVVEHPGILGEGWYAMAYVTGGNLADSIASGTLTREQIFTVLGDVASALEHAWTHGHIVHRDVKPTNILLDESKRGKLTDFDLATSVDLYGLTVAYGDYEFIAPEAREASWKPDPRADVYSLGVTALYALTGGLVPRTSDDKLEDVLLRADLFGSAAGAIRRALDNDPAVRQSSPSELVVALNTPSPVMSSEAERILWSKVSPNVAIAELARIHLELEQVSGLPDRRHFFEACGRSLDRVPVIDYRAIAAGEFMMGSEAHGPEQSRREGPRHRVRLGAFDLAATVVTNAQYEAFDPDHKRLWAAVVDAAELDDHPVVRVNWLEAYLFCRWIGSRLPSEAEWEYACRAGTETPFSTGLELSADYAHCDGESRGMGRTVAVRSLKPNPWGLFGMHGNVWEWCADSRHADYDGAPADGSAWIDKERNTAMLRGGSWFNESRKSRSAHRTVWFVIVSTHNCGFRPAR